MATKVGSSKKPVKETANEIILNSAATNFIELHSLVESYEAKWKSNHGPVLIPEEAMRPLLSVLFTDLQKP